MYNPLTPQIGKIHNEDIKSQVVQVRPVRSSRMVGRFIIARTLFHFGDFLIILGNHLHKRFDPVLYSDPSCNSLTTVER